MGLWTLRDIGNGARWRCNFKRLSQDGGRADFSENLRSAPYSLMPTYRMKLLSAKSISLVPNKLSQKNPIIHIYSRWFISIKDTSIPYPI